MRSIYKRETFSLIWVLFIRMFGNKFVDVCINLIMTTIISIHTANINLNSDEWVRELIVLIGIAILLNSIMIFADYQNNKLQGYNQYCASSHDVQNRINYETATKLYRVNKKITEAIRTGEIRKGELSGIADFQNLSFLVCSEIYTFITRNFDCGDCEVTIFQRFTNNGSVDCAKMIAFRNTSNTRPSSYDVEYKLNQRIKPPFFTGLFNDLNADVKVLANKKAVRKAFEIFPNSKVREEKICQYIGIPIKTDRKKVEILLQIDVSKEKALGKNKKKLFQFANDVIQPYGNLLHCSYERDLILSKFYDILESNIHRGN